MITPGNYHIQQLSNKRFVDAHESSNDFSVVTRTQQTNLSQVWALDSSNNDTFTLRQGSTGRFMDAHQTADDDFSVVTRNAQNNNTQRWTIEVQGVWARLVQRSTFDDLDLRFMDAHENSSNDFSVVTRPAQGNSTQVWIFKRLGGLGSDIYSIQQWSNRRFLDAHESAANDFSVVTRPSQQNDTQRWIVRSVPIDFPLAPGATVTIQQVSSARFVDAHQSSSNDFSVVTRPAQNNDTQRWRLESAGCIVTIQQASSNRFLDAHENSSNDFSVVTRSAQNNDTQLWVLTSFNPVP